MLTMTMSSPASTRYCAGQVANGVLHVRSHVDTTDPALVALDALVEVRSQVQTCEHSACGLPQEGIVSFPDGEKLIAESCRRGSM